jgi:hypothetical protein
MESAIFEATTIRVALIVRTGYRLNITAAGAGSDQIYKRLNLTAS